MKKDLRIIKTLKAIDDALIKLLHEKTFEEITIKEICDEALINRGTFYSHYKDKYELIESYQEMLVKGVRDILYKTVTGKNYQEVVAHDLEETTVRSLQFIKDNRDKVLVVLESVDNASFAEYFTNHMFSFYVDKSRQLGIHFGDETEKEYMITYVTHAHMGIFLKWIRNGCDVPIKTMSQYIKSFTIEGVFHNLFLNK